MDKNSKIYIAGHRGLVGSAIYRHLKANGFDNLITRTHAELDLERQVEVEEFFEAEKPECVFLAAAKVGGIWANSNYPAQFIYNNLVIQTNVLHAAWNAGVKTAPLPGVVVHISPGVSSANEGRVSPHRHVGAHKSALCNS